MSFFAFPESQAYFSFLCFLLSSFVSANVSMEEGCAFSAAFRPCIVSTIIIFIFHV